MAQGFGYDYTNTLLEQMVSADELVAVTKSDSTVYDPPLRGLYVGTTGDVAIRTASMSSAVTLKAVPAGAILPILAARVMSTGTTAADIVGLR